MGIGDRTGLAERLHDAGIEVVVLDIKPIELPMDIACIQGDVTEVSPDVFRPMDAVYARRLPPELHRPAAVLAETLDADLYFTTLGGEFPTIEVETNTADGETVHYRPADSHMVL